MGRVGGIGRRAWETIGGRLSGPCYLSREDHSHKIMIREQIPAELLDTFPCSLSTFKQKVRKAATNK
jgi:hypothetical protein